MANFIIKILGNYLTTRASNANMYIYLMLILDFFLKKPTLMLNAKLNGSSNAIKVKTSSETSGGTASNSRLPTVTTLSKTQLKVTQCLVLFIILVLVAILCSVFIRPEIFFSDYGKQYTITNLLIFYVGDNFLKIPLLT